MITVEIYSASVLCYMSLRGWLPSFFGIHISHVFLYMLSTVHNKLITLRSIRQLCRHLFIYILLREFSHLVWSEQKLQVSKVPHTTARTKEPQFGLIERGLDLDLN